MFASLRFPAFAAEELQYDLPADLTETLGKSSLLTPEERSLLAEGLCRTCPDPTVLEYRGCFAEELFSSPDLCRVMTDFGALGRMLPDQRPAREVDALGTVARFEAFAAAFDAFFATLGEIVPESEGAKRCLRFLKRYGESYEYKELKHKGAELVEAFGFGKGGFFTLGKLCAEGTGRVFPANGGEELFDGVLRVTELFGGQLPSFPEGAAREYTDTEAAVLTGMIRGNEGLSLRLKEFLELYLACGTEDFLRLAREASFFVAMNKIYAEGVRRGAAVCRPRYRAPGFYSEITGLCYATAEGIARGDFVATPLNPVTVVCGPDSAAYLNSVAVAHVFASAGGLIFAEGGEISPCDRMERDEKEQIHTEGLNENSLCLCCNLFDMMLPRQEEAAVKEVLLRLCECTVRSVVRICAQSNLSALQKQMEEGALPPCTLLRAGTDRTLEELLKRHHLTADALEGIDHE